MALSTSGLGRHSFKVVGIKFLAGSNPVGATKKKKNKTLKYMQDGEAVISYGS